MQDYAMRKRRVIFTGPHDSKALVVASMIGEVLHAILENGYEPVEDASFEHHDGRWYGGVTVEAIE